MVAVNTADNVRIGTAEREDAIRCLGEHFTAGRLGTDEYEQRAGQAAAAVVRGDLAELFTDLPVPHPGCLAPPVPVPPPAPPAPMPAPPAPPVPRQPDRDQLIAGALQVLLPFGIGRFYLGDRGVAIAQLLTVFIGVGLIWSFVDGVLLLIRSGNAPPR